VKLHNESILSTVYTNAESRRERIIWAPPVLNAAAILGVANVIANVRDPDSALDMLLGPCWCFIMGAAMGAIANFNYARLGELEARNAADSATIAAALEKIASIDELDDHEAALAVDLSTALICGRLEEELPEPSIDRAAAIEKFDIAQRELSSARGKRNTIRHRNLRILWVVVLTSISLFIGGFAWITVAHETGRRLVPPPPIAAPTGGSNAVERSLPGQSRAPHSNRVQPNLSAGHP
jgi:hypothetical protein